MQESGKQGTSTVKGRKVSNSLKKLKERILSLEGPIKIAIGLHENPDPDSMASAMGLEKILTSWNSDIKCTYLYSGEISHSQNRTMVNLLNIPLSHIGEIENLEEAFDVFMTVDAMPERCFKDKKIKCLMVIDHHRSETKLADISDIRQVGATSSIIWEYMQKEGIELKKDNDSDADIATALVIGIKTDTNDHTSDNVTNLDYEAFQNLMPYVNQRFLQSIIEYPIAAYYFELRSRLDQEENVKIDNSVFVGGIGCISPSKRDALPEMAKERARVEGIDTAFVFAIVGDYIEVSVRSVGVSVDVNALCQKIFGKEYAGGKMGSGAAKIPLGYLSIDSHAPEALKDKMWESVRDFMIHKIFHVISST